MGRVLSEDAVNSIPELTDKLNALSALLQELIGRLGAVAAAQAALQQHGALLAELRQAMQDAPSTTLHWRHGLSLNRAVAIKIAISLIQFIFYRVTQPEAASGRLSKEGGSGALWDSWDA